MNLFDFMTQKPLEYSGRTGDQVRSTMPPMEKISEQDGTTKYRFVKKMLIAKTYEDPAIGQIEYNMYKRLEEKGLPVAKAISFDGQTLITEESGGVHFTSEIGHICNAARWGMHHEKEGEEFTNQLGNFFCKTLDFVAKVDETVNDALTQQEKEYLTAKQTSKIANHFNVSKEEAQQHMHAYRAMQGLGIDDPAFKEQYAPIARRLKQAEQEYGIWTWGCDVRNIFVQSDGSFKAIDFNNLRFAPRQTSDSYILDAYLPLKNFSQLLDLPSPLSEGDRWQMIGYRAKAHNDRTGKTTADAMEYAQHFTPARIERNLRQFGHAMKEVRSSQDYFQIYDGMNEAIQAANIALAQINYLAKEDNSLHKLKYTVLASLDDQLQAQNEKYRQAEELVRLNS